MSETAPQRARLRSWIVPCLCAIAASAATTLPWGEDLLASRETAVFDAVVRGLRRYYVEDVAVDRLAWRALDEMVHGLDPHNRYVAPEEFAAFMHRNEGVYTGIGVVLETKEPVVKVVIEGGPADEAGLRKGDRILAVAGEPTEGMEREAILQSIRGPKGTRVDLTIRSPGEPERTVRVERRDIQIPSVFGARIVDPDARIGLLRIGQFQNRTADEFLEAVRNLRRAGMASLVLDLRNNTGGFFEESLRVADALIPDGVIVITRGRDGEEASRTFEAKPSGTLPPPLFPLAVLINGSTASAAEIVAGAVQDPTHRRGILVGGRSYGKGSVQTIFPILEKPERYGALKLTTRRYYTPSGRSLSPTRTHEGGLVPDVPVQEPEDFQDRYYEWVAEELYERINEATEVIAGPPPDLGRDPTLAEAVACLRDPARYEAILRRSAPGPEPRGRTGRGGETRPREGTGPRRETRPREEPPPRKEAEPESR